MEKVGDEDLDVLVMKIGLDLLSQVLEQKVKEGNTDPREQLVALEAVVSPSGSCRCPSDPEDSCDPCLSSEEGLPHRDPSMWDRRPQVLPLLSQAAR